MIVEATLDGLWVAWRYAVINLEEPGFVGLITVLLLFVNFQYFGSGKLGSSYSLSVYSGLVAALCGWLILWAPVVFFDGAVARVYSMFFACLLLILLFAPAVSHFLRAR